MAMKPIVALMMSRDEADVIGYVLESWRAFGIPVLAIDDSSDGTFEILQSFDNVTALRQEDYCPKGEKGPHNWVLNPLLDLKRSIWGDDTWVLIANADEVWYHAPAKIAQAMEAEGAETLLSRMCNHLLHPEDEANFDFGQGQWKQAVQSLPLARQVPWYTAHWFEYRGFLDRPGYTLTRDQGLLPLNAAGPVFSQRPIIQHHSIRNPLQAIARAKDRVDRHFQPAYKPYYYEKNPHDVFYENFAELGIELEKFSGSYGAHEAGLEYLLDR
jgi:hypothetical protein